MPTTEQMRAKGWTSPGDAGSAHEARWKEQNLVWLDRDRVRALVHREVRPIFAAYLDDLIDAGFRPNKRQDDWAFSNRPIRGTEDDPGPTKWSMHRWALALDLDAIDNPSVRPGTRRQTTMPANTARLASALMLEWGGTWNDPYDPMHAEFTGTVQDARRIREQLRKGAHAPDRPRAGGHRTVRPGDKGNAVRRAQKELRRIGYDIDVDGVFGPQTAAAVQHFQKRHGLDPDSIVGPLTWAALERAK